MGGGGGFGKDLMRAASDTFAVMLAGPTAGTSLQLGQDTRSSGLNPMKVASPALNNMTGVTQAKAASNALITSQQAQDTQAAATAQQLLAAPKTITPDNFLATKNAQLANLRLGLASTMTGAGGGGGVPSPVLSRPSLQASGSGKTRFGS